MPSIKSCLVSLALAAFAFSPINAATNVDAGESRALATDPEGENPRRSGNASGTRSTRLGLLLARRVLRVASGLLPLHSVYTGTDTKISHAQALPPATSRLATSSRRRR